MSGSVRKALPNVQEALLNVRSGWKALTNVRELSGDPPGCPGVIERPSRMIGSGRKTLPNVRKVLMDIQEKGWMALPEVREWSADTPGCS